MKTSEMIKTLQHMEKSYGDLEIELELGINQKLYQARGILYVDFNEYDGQDNSCSIRNFPY